MNRLECSIVCFLLLITISAIALLPPASRAVDPAGAIPSTDMPVPQPSGAAVGGDVSDLPSTSLPTATGTPIPSVTPTLTGLAGPLGGRSSTTDPSLTATAFPFDTRPGLAKYVYIDQATQHMYLFERGELVRDIPCSTGLPDPDKYTEAWSGQIGQYWGTFYAFDVYADGAWYLYKSAGSILIHSLPYTLENGYKVYQDRGALGVRPSSHGCVRLAPEDAQWFTAWGPEGVHATVTDPYRDRWYQ